MNWIWQYGNTQDVCIPTAYFLKSIGGGKSRRGRRWGSPEGNSFLLPKCHNSLDRLTSDVHLNLPLSPSCYYLPSDFFLGPCCLANIPSIPSSSSFGLCRPLLPPSSHILCPACLTQLVSAQRGWMPCLSIGWNEVMTLDNGVTLFCCPSCWPTTLLIC